MEPDKLLGYLVTESIPPLSNDERRFMGVQTGSFGLNREPLTKFYAGAAGTGITFLSVKTRAGASLGRLVDSEKRSVVHCRIGQRLNVEGLAYGAIPPTTMANRKFDSEGKLKWIQ